VILSRIITTLDIGGITVVILLTFFRAQGWEVIEYPYREPEYAPSEGQPSLGFKAAL